MKKLEGGLWESKLILPEHRSGMERELKESQRREKPILDEQQLEEIDKALYYSSATRYRLRLNYGTHIPTGSLKTSCWAWIGSSGGLSSLVRG
ncbi:YolD-like protein [Paenibacillus sophorae]|uniref:YolD-like family protein n=1 Tax=Paenibacillus sophorae TaxID=1333845 RepID=A0A1H8VJT8_9BACL|nr:YolD-like family protein [Paenibacillus sophorae]QWU17209.1 YolD-like family protein [Paenibacillus sophorae]SEP15649.1 YolD-like protein [Paenibacillus sophorae]